MKVLSILMVGFILLCPNDAAADGQEALSISASFELGGAKLEVSQQPSDPVGPAQEALDSAPPPAIPRLSLDIPGEKFEINPVSRGDKKILSDASWPYSSQDRAGALCNEAKKNSLVFSFQDAVVTEPGTYLVASPRQEPFSQKKYVIWGFKTLTADDLKDFPYKVFTSIICLTPAK